MCKYFTQQCQTCVHQLNMVCDMIIVVQEKSRWLESNGRTHSSVHGAMSTHAYGKSSMSKQRLEVLTSLSAPPSKHAHGKSSTGKQSLGESAPTSIKAVN